MSGAGQEDRVEAFFDAEAARYDAAYESDDWAGRFLRARLDAVLAVVGDGPGNVLDAGMGGGRLVEELDRRGWTVSGVDNSGAMVELAARRLPHLGERFCKVDLVELPFPDASFDAVAATGVVEYVGDLERGLAELARVLRGGGKLAVSFPNYRSPHALWRRFALYPAARLAKRVLPFSRRAPMRPLHPITPRAFEQALARAGFRLVARRPIAARVGGGSRLGQLVAPQLLFEAVK